MSPSLSVQTDVLPRSVSPHSSTPQSAIIDVPPGWGSPIGSSGSGNGNASGDSSSRQPTPSAGHGPSSQPQQYPPSRSEGEPFRPQVDLEPPLPLSASSSSSSSAHFPWPAAPVSYSNIVRDRSDPFDSTTSFAEDPFARSSSSSSGDDDHRRRSSQYSDSSSHAPHHYAPYEPPQYASSSTSSSTGHPYHPTHVRSATDPNIHDGVPIDAELAVTSAIQHSSFPFDAGLSNGSNGGNGFHLPAASASPALGSIPHPTLNRTFSSPLPNRVGSLRHPLSPTLDRLGSYAAHPPATLYPTPSISSVFDARPASSTVSSDSTLAPHTPLETLSLELADSLQTAIQTLLHLSPPHMLDNAKEQYSGCTVQMPTTSLSALLTSMRGLNYLSANVVALCEGLGNGKNDVGILAGGHRAVEDFDIGELLQNVADLLSGQAAQAGVDLVLFHGDVGIKHTSVSGDREGIAYALSYVIRQILLVASKGDTIELGLQITPQSPTMTPRVAAPLSVDDVEANRTRRSASPGRTLPDQHLTPDGSGRGSAEGPMLCVFEIVHNIFQTPDSNSATPRAELNPFTRLVEEKEASTPKLDSLLCRRLLQHVNASLKTNAQPSSPLGIGLPRHGYEVAVLLPRGRPIEEPTPLSSEEQAVRQPFSTMTLAREPTLRELSEFAESLRGKKVYLHASLGSVFARHLTSYLAAWGLDVSHIAIEEEDELAQAERERSLSVSSAASASAVELSRNMAGLSIAPMSADKFIVIDDDVSVLRRELVRLKAEIPSSNKSKTTILRRPSISNRTRSTPHMRTGMSSAAAAQRSTPILIHFTSLAKYNQVRDVVTSLLGAGWSMSTGALAHPEVMVIPKPVGPRRFLTALHTAVNQPIVDPFFSPIATSPRSPGGPGYIGGARTPTERETGFFDSVAEEQESDSQLSPQSQRVLETASKDARARSPLGEFPPSTASIIRTDAGLHLSIPTPGEIVATPASEYFSSVKPNTSGASGVVMQSPDGRPFGMFFEPPVKGELRRTSVGRIPSDSMRRNTVNRRTSAGMGGNGAGGGVGDSDAISTAPGSTTTSPQTASRRTSGVSITTATDDSSRRSSTAQVESTPTAGPPTSAASPPPAASTASRIARRRTMPIPPAGGTGEPVLAQGRDRASTLSRALRNTPKSSPNPNTGSAQMETPLATPSSVGKGSTDTLETVPFHPPRMGKRAQPTTIEEITKVAGPTSGMGAKASDVVVPPINVLIVEDNPINQNILKMFFMRKKIQHSTAKDGLEAVEKWKTGGFHLILMDIQLPVMDGIAATKEIRKLEKNNNIGVFPSTPVSEHPRPFSALSTTSTGSAGSGGAGGGGVGETINSAINAAAAGAASSFRSAVIIVALTASSLQTDRVAALAAGCNDFLTKPVSLKWLEKKTIEWGCMQALIDFDGWRRWKGADPKDETKRGFQLGPQAQARTLASKLRIDRTKSRSLASVESTDSASGPDIHVQSATPEPSMSLDSTTSAASAVSAVEAAVAAGVEKTKSVLAGLASSPSPSPGAEGVNTISRQSSTPTRTNTVPPGSIVDSPVAELVTDPIAAPAPIRPSELSGSNVGVSIIAPTDEGMPSSSDSDQPQPQLQSSSSLQPEQQQSNPYPSPALAGISQESLIGPHGESGSRAVDSPSSSTPSSSDASTGVSPAVSPPVVGTSPTAATRGGSV